MDFADNAECDERDGNPFRAAAVLPTPASPASADHLRATSTDRFADRAISGLKREMRRDEPGRGTSIDGRPE